MSKAANQQAVIVSSDILSGDARQEIIDTIIGGIDKFCSTDRGNMEEAAKWIKESLDKHFGLTWQVIIGNAFGFDITSLENNLLHCYYQGDIGVLVYKT